MTTGMKGFLWVSNSRQRCKMLALVSLLVTFQINRFSHLTLFCPFFFQGIAMSLDPPPFPSIRDCLFSILAFSTLLIPSSLIRGREEFGSKAFSPSKIFIVFNLNWIFKKAGGGAVERECRVHTLVRRAF